MWSYNKWKSIFRTNEIIKHMNQKIKYNTVLSYLGDNFEEFLSQARIKLYKQKKFLNPNNEFRELVSDIIYSIIEKMEDPKHPESIDRFYNMVKSDKLRLYVHKSISINTKFNTSPFLVKKLKEKNRIQLTNNPDINFIQKTWNVGITFVPEDKPSISDVEEKLLIQIDKIKESENAQRVFGRHWKYYLELIEIYLKYNCSYRKIEEQTQLRNCSYHYRKIWELIRTEISNNKTN